MVSEAIDISIPPCGEGVQTYHIAWCIVGYIEIVIARLLAFAVAGQLSRW